MPDKDLPLAARGVFTKGEALKEMGVKAHKEGEYNNARSKERKAKLGRATYHPKNQSDVSTSSSG